MTSTNFYITISHNYLVDECIRVFTYDELTKAISNIPTNVLILSINDVTRHSHIPGVFPSLAHLTSLKILSFTGITFLTLPELSSIHYSGEASLRLQLCNCCHLDTSSIHDNIRELSIANTIENYSGIDRIRLPSQARLITITNTPIGVILPPSNFESYLPYRGFLVLNNSPLKNYPILDKLIRPHEYTNHSPNDCSSDPFHLELENSIMPDPGNTTKLRMYEAYLLIDVENRYVLKYIFPQIETCAINHVVKLTTTIGSTTNYSNLHLKFPITRMITLSSKPLKRSLEFIE